MTRYTLTLPEPHDGEDTAGILSTLFGGYTRTAGEGGWRSPLTDQLFREPVTVYTVDTDRDDAGPIFADLARDLATKYQQEAVYVTRQPVETFLIAPAKQEV